MAVAIAEYPKKLFYKINEVAEIVGVEAYVLRYWETKFPMLKPERYGNDERRYRAKDIDLLLRVRRLLYDEKYTIAGAVERVRKDPKGKLDTAPATLLADDEPVSQPGNGRGKPAPDGAPFAQKIARVREQLADVKAELIAITQQVEVG